MTLRVGARAAAFLIAVTMAQIAMAGATADCASAQGNPFLRTCEQWGAGFEGQRKADLGDGRYRNPIVAGDHPDPTVVKDGDDYYMTFSSFEAYPGLTIWHSRDLVNWRPTISPLTDYIGSAWAPELVKHDGRFYLYIPVKLNGRGDIYVMHAPQLKGPWTSPVSLGINRIDPGHAVGEDGRRYLFLSGGDRVKLADDGTRTDGPIEHVYDGWRYPDDWDVESYSQEGPKLLKHGDYFYMTLALGGTAGPPTSHMVISARSKSIHGPWENSPHNPITRTRSAAEKWWSKGHATVVQGPNGKQWFLVYHGYEAGFQTLGRQALMTPIEWTADGWFKASSHDAGASIPKPAGGSLVPHGATLSDDFSEDRLGRQWRFFGSATAQRKRVNYASGTLEFAAQGKSPADSPPLSFVVGDQAYEMEIDIDIDDGAQAGLLVFYNERLYAGFGVNNRSMVLHRYGLDQRISPKPVGMGNHFRMRLRNDRHVVTLFTSGDNGVTWTKYATQMDVSGYHHNVAYGFMSLRPAIYVAGQGAGRFRNMTYRALP